MTFFKNIFSYWLDLVREIRIWYIFRKTAYENVEMLNTDNSLRVDWLGRIYGVVNLPEEVQTAAQQVQEAYVLQNITTYGDVMTKIGLADIVYPERVGAGSYLVVLWPVFEAFNIWSILGNIIRTGFFIAALLIFIGAMNNNSEYMISFLSATWEGVASLF